MSGVAANGIFYVIGGRTNGPMDGLHLEVLARAMARSMLSATGLSMNPLTSTTATGSYKAGTVIPITVNFSEPVTVTGTPQVQLNTTPAMQTADYASGSSTATLTFKYTVAPGQNIADLKVTKTASDDPATAYIHMVGVNPNGTWQLRAFDSRDAIISPGSTRAWSERTSSSAKPSAARAVDAPGTREDPFCMSLPGTQSTRYARHLALAEFG